MKNSFRCLVGAALIGFTVNAAAELPNQPLSQVQGIKSFSETVNVPALNLNALRNKAAVASKPGPLQFAEPYAITKTTDKNSNWLQTFHQNENYSLLRYRIESPNAYSLNLGFSEYYMPKGGQLFLYNDDYSRVVGPFTVADNDDHGQLWTPIFGGKTITVEVNIPTDKLSELKLTLSSINQAFLDMHNLTEDLAGLKSGSCNVDVACSQADPWSDQVRSVARYSLGGAFFCSGAAINTNSAVPERYFLTADHCGINAGNAPSVVVHWNYENSTCRAPGSFASGQPGDGPFTQFNTGTIFRAEYSNSDMTLLEFDDPILPAANVYLAGWDRSGSAPNSAVAIHHPAVDEKRISFENNPLSISSYLGNPGSGSTHLRVADWDLGTTEGGSSGSPLFDPNQRIIGQLHGGFAACGNNDPDWYGRLSVSWTGGGSNGTRLSNWLDSAGTSPIAINGRDANVVLMPDDFEPDDSSGAASDIAIGETQEHNIVPVGDEDWMKITLTEPTRLVIRTSGPDNSDTRLWLYDNSLTELAFDDDSGNGLFSRIISDELAAGTYFIQVDEFGDNDFIASYSISVSAIDQSGSILDFIPAIISTIPL